MFVAMPSSVLLQAQVFAANADDSATGPNIVLMMTDDMGYGDLGFHGNPMIDTPNLDAMAKRASIVKQFYVSPVCAPARLFDDRSIQLPHPSHRHLYRSSDDGYE